MKKEYWLYLETYVFLWSDSQEIVLYESLSGKGYVYRNNVNLYSLIKQLKDKSNLYCITVTETELDCSEIRDFIFFIREKFCGDLLDKSIFKQKPLVIIPELNVNEEVFTGEKTIKRDIAAGIHAEKNLLGLTVYLTGKCELDCVDCEQICKQMSWCTKNEHILPKEILFDILAQTRYTSISEIKFIGGNIFTYLYWDDLIDELQKYSLKKMFYTDFRLLPLNLKQLEIFDTNGFTLCLLVDVFYNKEQIVNKAIPIDKRYNYLFIIRAFDEFEMIQSIVDQYQIESKIIPYYDSTNLHFFEENIFQSVDDIVNTLWKKNEIFAHTVLNTNFFGKFTVLSNGKIYANVNYDVIGDVKTDNIKLLVNQELKNGKSWLLTRSKISPCDKCLYKYLCPSISDYEIAIGQNNLCHV